MNKLKFKTCDKDITDAFSEFLKNQEENLKCNINIPIKMINTNENIVRFELFRNYDVLISINSINNLDFVKSINLAVTCIKDKRETFKLSFEKEIFLPIFMLSCNYVILEVEYVEKKYITDKDNFILNCDCAYLTPSIRGNQNIGRKYLNDFIDLCKKNKF